MNRIERYMKIKKSNLLSLLILIPFFLWCFTAAGLSVYVYPSVTARVYTLFIPLVATLLIMSGKYLEFKINLNTRELFAILSCLVLFINNQNFAHNNYSVEIAYIILIFITIVLSRTKIWMDTFLKIVTLGGLIFSAFTLICYISPSFYEGVIFPLFYTGGYNDLLINYQNGYIAGLTNHVSSNGCYLTLLIGISGCTLITQKSKRMKWIIIFITTVVSLLLTGKRAHTIFAIVALFITYWIFNSDRQRTRWVKVLGIGIIAIVIFFVAVQFVPELDNFILKFSETAADGDVTKGRSNQSLLALSLFASSPIMGIGWDAYKYYYQNLTGVFLNVHNVYIQILCESGLIGALVYFTFFTLNIVHCIKVFRVLALNKSRIGNDKDAIRLSYSCFMQVFFLLYCLTGNPLYDSQVVFPYMFCCAISEYYYRTVRGRYLGRRPVYENRDTNIPLSV